LGLQKWKLACSNGQSDFVFPNRQGEALEHHNVMKHHFNPALRRTKLRKVSFHSLRHTNASIRIQAGQDIKYMQTQLGHSSVQITLDIYGHLFNDIDFNNKQLELPESSFRSAYHSVRNPLEKAPKIEREPSKSSLTI
jgi:integrase